MGIQRAYYKVFNIWNHSGYLWLGGRVNGTGSFTWVTNEKPVVGFQDRKWVINGDFFEVDDPKCLRDVGVRFVKNHEFPWMLKDCAASNIGICEHRMEESPCNETFDCGANATCRMDEFRWSGTGNDAQNSAYNR